MRPSSDDATPYDHPTIEPNKTTPRDIRIEAQAEPFSTQIVGGHGDIHYAPNIYTGHAWVHSDEIADNQVAEAQKAFVPPPGYGDAWSTLNSRNVLIISAAPGTGKRTAAVNLLAELRQPRPERQHTAQARPNLELRELDEDWEKPRISKLQLFPDQGLLLDLSDSLDQAPGEEFGTQLVDYASKLAAIKSFLIVLTTPEVWKACAGSTSDLTVRDLGRPTAYAIVEARLTHSSSPYPERVQWLSLDGFREILRHNPLPGDLDGLYQAIVAAEDSPAGRADAVDQFHGWRRHLTDWWKSEEAERGPYERAMQIVAATVGSAPAGDILTMTDHFLEVAGHATDVHRPLSGPDLSERLRRVGAVTGEDGLVELEPTRPRFHGAVLDHVWRERVQIHNYYKQWIVQVTTDGRVGKKYIEQIAASVTGMGIRRDSVEFLELIENWVKNRTDQDILATRMLEDTCLDPVVGAKVRKRLRAWSDQKSTPERLVDIVIAVCQGELGRERTVVALTRLKKILLRSNADLFAEKVSAAIVAIAHYPGRLQEVLAEVIGWMGEPNPTPGQTGFLALMEPYVEIENGGEPPVARLLTECRHDDDIRNVLAAAWHTAVYADPSDGEVVSAIRRLLSFANRRPEFIDITVDIIGPAIQGNLKKTIAGKVLFNPAVGNVEDGGNAAHLKLLDLLFDETHHAVPATPVSVGFPVEETLVDTPDAVEGFPMWNSLGPDEVTDEPRKVDGPSSTAAVEDDQETVTDQDNGSGWADRGSTITDRQSESSDLSAPAYPIMPTAPPPDGAGIERRSWFRR
ncbi:hypothetical protein GCM10010492_70370 [Saccharothrix mutabilis subsp. mutabilis]|uniref:Uncharacterized protein n=1 Tax=Saccharothrix mutabilis subsp. mutabilis TaxID=66855 RepID=A0ABN0URL0_9PSEU